MNREKITKEDEFVTKNFLREAFVNFGKEMDKQFERNTDIVIREIHTMRKEMREFHQAKDALERSDIIQERKIDELDSRVLKLETAR